MFPFKFIPSPRNQNQPNLGEMQDNHRFVFSGQQLTNQLPLNVFPNVYCRPSLPNGLPRFPPPFQSAATLYNRPSSQNLQYANINCAASAAGISQYQRAGVRPHFIPNRNLPNQSTYAGIQHSYQRTASCIGEQNKFSTARHSSCLGDNQVMLDNQVRKPICIYTLPPKDEIGATDHHSAQWSNVDERLQKDLERQTIEDCGPTYRGDPNDKTMTEWKDSSRCWKSFNKKRKKSSGTMKLSVMSYNVLSQSLLEEHSFLYNDCYHDDLNWAFRGPALMRQFEHHKSDILCLQEVQEDHWKMFFRPQLKSLGYDGHFVKRTGDKPDGCAILFHKKFKLIKFVPVNFQRGGLLDRDNVGVILLLKPRRRYYRGSVRQVCVATTHLLFNPKRGDVKLAQLMLFLAEIEKYSYLGTASQTSAQGSKTKTPAEHSYCPVVLCGDMNFEPISQLFDFIIKGHIQYDKCVSQYLSGQREGFGRGYSYVTTQLLPENVGINEHCQYIRNAVSRLSADTPHSNNTSDSACGESSRLKEGEINSGTSLDKNGVRSLMNTGSAFHNFKFKSVYPHQSSLVTTHHGRASCMVDYIFYSSGQTISSSKYGECNTSSEYDLMKRKRTESTNSEKQISSVAVPHKTLKSEVEQVTSNCDDLAKQERSSKVGSSVQNKRLGVKYSLSQGSTSDAATPDSRCSPEPTEILSSDDLDDCLLVLNDKDNVSKIGSAVSRDSILEVDNRSYLDHNDNMHNCAPTDCERDEKPVSVQTLELLGYWSLLSSREFHQLGCLPSNIFPSDHICLIAKFLLH